MPDVIVSESEVRSPELAAALKANAAKIRDIEALTREAACAEREALKKIKDEQLRLSFVTWG